MMEAMDSPQKDICKRISKIIDLSVAALLRDDNRIKDSHRDYARTVSLISIIIISDTSPYSCACIS